MNRRTTTRHTLALPLTALALTACLAASAGCYKRVTKAQGIGADAHYPERAEPSTNRIDQTLDKIFEPDDE